MAFCIVVRMLRLTSAEATTTMDKPRCSDHRARPELPRACAICNRIAIEQDIITRTVDALLASGYALATDEGDHRFFGESNPSRDRAAVLASLMETDDEHLGIFDADEATGQARVCKPWAWVRFVYGNDGYDVISDYTTSLEDVLAPVNKYADSLA